MDFQGLEHIEDAQFYLNTAIQRAKKRVNLKIPMIRKTVRKDKIQYLTGEKTLTLEFVTSFNRTTKRTFDRIITKYPSFDNLDEFYYELISTFADPEEIKKTLGAINWVKQSVSKYSAVYAKKIKLANTRDEINQFKKEYVGRIASFYKQISKELLYLQTIHQQLRTLPNVKTSQFTAVLAGFPNVGKSTLLSKVTPAKPEINSYAFTTKKLNLGYNKIDGMKVQYIDTPGALNRDKLNDIERVADLALKYVAKLIVYVIDLTESSYPLQDQINFLKYCKEEYDVPIIIYLSKSDLLDKNIIEEYKKDSEYLISEDLDFIEEQVVLRIKEYYKGNI